MEELFLSVFYPIHIFQGTMIANFDESFLYHYVRARLLMRTLLQLKVNENRNNRVSRFKAIFIYSYVIACA